MRFLRKDARLSQDFKVVGSSFQMMGAATEKGEYRERTMFPGTHAPRYLCSPVPMFPGTYVPRFAVNDSNTPPRLIFLSLQIDMII